MKSHWQKPLVIVPLLAAITLFGLSGLASAKVTDVQIQSPTEASPVPGYVKPGGTVTVTASVTVDATADVWMDATIGSSTIAASKVGTISGAGSDNFSVIVPLGSGETDGWKNVTVRAYAQADGITLSDTEANAVHVDATAPSIGPWSPGDASFANITTQTFVVPVSDAASGVNWGGIGTGSVDVTGGALQSISYNSGEGRVTIAIRDMNTPGSKSVTLRVSDVAGNQATDTHSFTIVDSAKPTMGAWDINGTGVVDGVWISSSSATFGEQITDALPSLGITSVTARLDGGSATPVPYDAGNRYAISYSGMSDGAHTLEFTATDGSGNSQSATLHFNVDTVDPMIDDTTWSPASGSWVTSSSVIISVDASDSGSGIDGATANAWISPSAGVTVSPGYSSGSGKIIVDVSGLTEGDYTLYTSIKDRVGHTAATKSMTFKVDLGGPVFADPFPSNGLETKDIGIAPHIDITDTVSGIKSDSIIWTMTAPGGSSVGGARSWSDPRSTYTPSVALATNGTYALGVSARNNADLPSTYPASPDTWTFLLDTVAPSEATGAVVEDSGPSPRTIGTEQFTADTTPTVAVTVWDNTGGSGFNNEFGPSSIVIRVYSDAAMAAEVSGSTTPGARPSTNEGTWGGAWVPDGGLSDGDYYYQVIAKDDAGNEGTITSPSFKFTVDTTAPTDAGQAEVGSVNAANSKRFTNNPEISVTWAASTDGARGSGLIGYKLEIWTKAAADATPTGAKVYEASGIYDAWLGESFVAPCGPPFGLTEYYTTGALTLTSGTSYGAWIKAFDFLGNESAWFDPPFIYDSDAPSDPGTPLVVGISGAGEIANHAPTFQWAHSSDAKTGIPQSGVGSYEFQIKRAGGATWDVFATVIDIDDEDVDLDGSDTPLTGDLVWTLPSPYTLDDGEYVARVRSFDVAGNHSNWVESTTFEVDTTPPPIPGIPTTASPTNDQTPDWTWNPRDDMSVPGEAAASYNVYLDDAFVANVSANQFVESNYGPIVLAEGRHELQVTALDAVGNESARSATGHVVIDTAKPISPTMEALPQWTKVDTVMFTWTAVSDAALYTLKPSRNSVAQSPIPVTLTSCSVDVTSWDEGDVVGAVVTATDAAGNESDSSNEASTVIDRVKPTVTAVTTPPTPTTDTRPKWEWEAKDDGGSGVAYCMLTLDDSEPIQVPATVSSFVPEFDLPDGSHVLRVMAVDKAGNESGSLPFSEVVVDTKAIDAPAIEPIAKGYNTSPLTLKWNAVADGYNAITYVLQWAKDAGFSGAHEETIATGTQYEFSFTDIAHPENKGESEYWFRVKTISTVNATATPPETKESGWSAIVSTIYDVTGPVAPVLTLESKNPTNESTQEWTWTRPVDAVNYDLYWSETEDSAPEASTEPRAAGVGNIDLYCTSFDNPGEEKTYYVWVRGIDALGNKGLWSEKVEGVTPSVTVDMKAPGEPTGLAVTTPTTDRTPTWTWANPGNQPPNNDLKGYEVLLDGTGPIDVGLVWSYTHSETLDEGEHELQVRAYDELGNRSAWCDTVAVFIDTQAIDAPAIGLIAKGYNTSPLTLKWNAVVDKHNTENAITYVLQWAKDAGFSGAHDVPIATGTQYEFDFADPDKGESEYWFRVKTISTVNATTTPPQTKESGWSAIVSTIYDVTGPAAPVLTLESKNPTNESTQEWTWTRPVDAVNYDLYWSETEDSAPEASTEPRAAGVGNIDLYCTSFDNPGEEKTYYVWVRGIDALGNKGLWSEKVEGVTPSVTVDMKAPGEPTGLAVTTPTTDRTPTWSWTNPGNQPPNNDLKGYEVLLDGTGPIDVGLVWSYTHSETLDEGEHELQVRAYDDLGNKSEWCDPATVVIDTGAPYAPAIEPIAKGYNTSPLTLKWNAVADGYNAITYVLQWAKDAGFSGAHEETIATGTQYEFSFTDIAHPENKGESEYWFRVKTISTVNATATPPQTKESGWSAIVSTIYDVTGPAAPVLTLGSKNPTNESTQEWTWTRPVDAVNYDLYWSETDSAPEASTEPRAAAVGNIDLYRTSFANPGEEKTYYVWVRGIDALGNKGLWSEKVEGVTPSVTVDMKAPSKPVGLTVTTPTTDRTPTWSWTNPGGQPPNNDLKGYEVLLDGTGPIDVGLVWSYTHSETLDEGGHELQVRAYDDLGNKSEWCDPATVVIDTGAPYAPAIEPIAKGYNTSPLTLKWNAVADGYNAITYVLQWAKDAGFSGAHEETIATGTQYEFSFTDIAHPENKGESEYWFRVKTISTVNATATPPQTKESGWSAIVSTIYDVTGPAAPVLTLESKNPTNESTQEWTWTRPVDAVNYDLYWNETDSAPGPLTTPSAAGVGNIDLYCTSFDNPGEEKTYYVWVRGIDALGNKGLWSEKVEGVTPSVTVDMKGPSVSITSPAAAKNTNLSTFTWTWTVEDDEDGAEIQGYWVKLNDEAWSWTTETEFTSWRLRHGANVLQVKGVDNLGNEGAVREAPTVTLVDVAIFDLMPAPGEHPINEASTIVFSVAGLYDQVEVLLGNKPIEDAWRLVTIVNTPALAKFYILLDDAVMQPGPLTVTIKVGDVTRYCDYEVLDERTGFGFGRLRPW